MRFSRLRHLWFIFILMFLTSGCGGNIKFLDQLRPVSHPISKMDFPIYFGKNINYEKDCLKIVKDEGYILNYNESTTTTNVDERSTNVEKELNYENNLNNKLESLDQKGFKVILPEFRIEEYTSFFVFLINSYKNNINGVSADIIGCKKNK